MKAKRDRNSQRVAQALKFGINAFIWVQSAEMKRFSKTKQEILGFFHRWTNGAFWKRLIILDRASFDYASLVERSQKDSPYWFKSQTTDVEAFKRLVLDVGQKENWKIRRNDTEDLLKLEDLEGIKRLPFDAKQTIFCDKTKPGCYPSTETDCKNFKFRSCHEMPVWEHEAPIEYREYDYIQNDTDFYHEQEDIEVIKWADLDYKPKKYFFYEQLKILSKYIKETNTKIQIDRDVFKHEIAEWNDLYEKKFVLNLTDIVTCSTQKLEQKKLLKKKGRCNKWSNWITEKECPVCGQATALERRFCHEDSPPPNLPSTKWAPG